MNDKLIKLIEEKGPELATTLKIASEQVYDKILWYVRISGIKDIVTFLIVGLCAIPVFKLIKKVAKEMDNDPMVWIMGPVIAGIPLMLVWMIIDVVTMSLAKIFVPEYYLINQLIAKLGQ